MTITAAAKALIEDWRLGFVATADAEGTPNLSPKGTFVVLDEKTVAFAEMRSPDTRANIAVRPAVEVNFVDMLTRKGIVLRGTARFVGREDAAFAGLEPHFAAHWADLMPMVNGIVVITAQTCRPLQSPAYETGATAPGLRAHWMQRIAALNAAAGGDSA